MSCHTWPLTSLWDQQINSFMELFKTVSYCQCLYRQHRGIQRIMYGDSKYHVLVFLQISCHIWCLISLLHFMSAFLSSRSQDALFFLDYKDLKVHLKGARKTRWIYICTKTNTVYLKANTVHWVSCLGKGLHSECFVWCNVFGLLLIILLVCSNKDVLSFCVIICGCALRLILIVSFSISFSLLLSQLATFSSACLMICNLLVLSKEVDFSAKKQSVQGQCELCWKR